MTDLFTFFNKKEMSNVLLGYKELEEMLKARGNNETMTIAYKLSIEKHLQVKKQDRQRVRTAAQLISATTAHALEYLHPDNSRMLVLARFIRLADQWFDLLNSSQINHYKDVKSAFGVKLDVQMQVIHEVKKQIGSLRVGQRSGMIDWQVGILQSLTALPMLLDDLKKNELYGVCSSTLSKISL